MKTKILSEESQRSMRALIFETGDEVMSLLTEYVKKENIRAARFTAIGAFASATLAYFEWETKKYLDLPVDEQVEVLVLTGDIAWEGDKPVAHVHCVLGRRDGSTRGGHLKSAKVRPTLELILDQAGALERTWDQNAGLALVKPEA